MKLFGRCLLAAVVTCASAQVIHAPDPGSGERFSSFELPNKTDAPFRASVVTAWKYRSTTYWNKHTLFNRRTVARDRAGRVFQERRMFSPDGDRKSTTVSELDFYDATSGTVLVYDPRTQQCRRQSYLPIDIPRPLPLQQTMNGYLIQRESLGTTTLQGLEAVGSRESLSTSTQPGTATITEFWYSPQLAINLVMRRTDANRDMQTFTVQDIDLHEPDEALFTPPSACDKR